MAGSQSHTVIEDNSEDTMSSVEINARVMMTDASVVDELMYEKTDASVDEIRVPVECVQSSVCIQTAGQAENSQTSSSTRETPSFQVAGKNIRARFNLSKIEGGRFSLKLNSTEKKGGPVKEGVSLKCENGSDRFSVSNILKKNNLHARDEFCGENYSFNHIELKKINCTNS